MRTLTRKSLDELARTMSVIQESEQSAYWGLFDPINLSSGTTQTDHNANGAGVIDALKYFENNSSNVSTLNQLVNLNSVNWANGAYVGQSVKSGQFTYQGYTFNYLVHNNCGAYGLSEDCIWNAVSGRNFSDTHYAITNGSGNILSVTTTNQTAGQKLVNFIRTGKFE